MRKRGLHIVCMFLIYLVIIPTLYTANVFAEFFADAHGYDELSGFRKSVGDVTIINVSAKIPGETIDPWQIKMLSDPTRSFDCEEDNVSRQASCEMTIPGELVAGTYDYDVQLFATDGTEFEPKKVVTLYVDESAPVVHSFELIRNGTGVIAEYQVSDSLCPSCPVGVCSGVRKLEFLLNYALIKEVFPESDGRLEINRTVLDIPSVPGTSTKTICIDAYDGLFQKSSKCMDIVMDFSAPRLLNVSLYQGTKELKYNKGEPIGGLSLVAYIKEESGLVYSSLVADFSSLNSRREYDDLYKSVDNSTQNMLLFGIECTNTSEKNIHRCEWNNILMILPQNAIAEVNLFVEDNYTNPMNVTMPLPIVFDNTEPSITAIRSGLADEKGRYWVGAGNNSIFVDIVEDVSGFENKQLFLDFGSFGPQPYSPSHGTTLLPNNCTPSWVCDYDFINVVTPHESGDVLSVSVTGTSMDDAGNIVTGVTSSGFYYDNTAPEILGIQNSTVCPTAPDSIELRLNVSERYSGGVVAEVSAPDLSSSIFPQRFDCEESDLAGIWTCDIVIDNLVTFYVDGKINITLEDRAGNKNTTVVSQEVCEAAPGTPPNVISTTSCSFLPNSGIDRQVAEMISYPLFLRPTFTPISSGASIQSMKINKCTSDSGSFSDEYILDELNFIDPLIATKVALSSDALGTATKDGEESETDEYYNFVDPDTESIDIECEIELIVRAGTKVYQDPEIETFRCNDVPLHGTIFGGINSSVEATLRDIEGQIEAKEGEIDDYEGWVDVLGAICTIAEIVAKVIMALEMLREVLWLVLLIPYAIPQAKQGISTFFQSTCGFIEKASGYMSTLVWNIDSDIVYSGVSGTNNAVTSSGFYIKILCGILTCKLTEQNTWIELIGGAVGAEWSPTNEKSYSKFVERTERESDTNRFPEGDIGAPTSIPSDVYKVIFNAYRCKEMSIWGLCLPGYLFALRKERQLLCMKRNCYRDYVTAGFSPEICDKMYAGRQCLYVHSAAYKVSGDSVAGRIAQGIVEYLLVSATNSATSYLLREGLGCAYPYGINNWNEISDGADESCGGADTIPPEFDGSYFIDRWKHHVCGLALATSLWMDVGDWFSGDDFDLNYYNEQLGNPDYCSM